MGTTTNIYLPDGRKVQLPPAPSTWTDAGAGVQGSPLRAPKLELTAGMATAWHRQRPLFQGIATLSQSIPNATFTAITGWSELIDNWSGHSDSSNTGRYYAPYTQTGGSDWYLCTGLLPWNSTSASAVHIAGLRINGGGTIAEGSRIPSGTGHGVTSMVTDLVQMNGANNDYVELVGYQSTGGAIGTVVTGKTPALTVRWVCVDPTWAYTATPALPATPRTWLPTDYPTGSLVGLAPDGGQYVPLNVELRDRVHFLNNPPIARITASGTTQTIPSGSGTWTSVSFTGETVDNYNGWAASPNPTRYVCQRPGLYFVAGFVNVVEAGTNTGYRACRLLVNGANAYAGWSVLPQSSGTTGTGLYAVAHLRLAAGDYVEVQAQQTQGAALSLYGGAGNASRLVAVWVAK